MPQLFNSSKHSTQKIFSKKRPFFPTLPYCEFFIILFSHFYSDHTVLHVRSLHSISYKCSPQIHYYECIVYIHCISFLLLFFSHLFIFSPVDRLCVLSLPQQHKKKSDIYTKGINSISTIHA